MRAAAAPSSVMKSSSAGVWLVVKCLSTSAALAYASSVSPGNANSAGMRRRSSSQSPGRASAVGSARRLSSSMALSPPAPGASTDAERAAASTASADMPAGPGPCAITARSAARCASSVLRSAAACTCAKRSSLRRCALMSATFSTCSRKESALSSCADERVYTGVPSSLSTRTSGEGPAAAAGACFDLPLLLPLLLALLLTSGGGSPAMHSSPKDSECLQT
mmetsp:Transcript_12353/g.38099  ORF Transcript_12353/g.38099 Transcript_12353/m.38099 type:complete len:222 (+) Transcript_12353:2234-2899(+)